VKILITGNKGQLGNDCAQVFSPDHVVLATDLEELDITHLQDVEGTAEAFRPDWIVNCAAYTHVDACETQKNLAWQINVEGPRNLALCVEKYGGKLIHISTDYVFGGKKNLPEPYLEDDEADPSSYYGKTKLEGELTVKQITDRYIIIRTAWLYGIKGHNFLKTVLGLALKNPHKEIKVVNDQFGSPTWSYQLALQIAKLIDVNGKGIYHATAEGYCSWYQLAIDFFEKMEIPHVVVPCSTKEYPTPAVRPVNSILENERLKGAGINLMTDWRIHLDQFVSLFREHLLVESTKESLNP
jgi:dTDP-4-dehydrorhamnose reductase